MHAPSTRAPATLHDRAPPGTPRSSNISAASITAPALWLDLQRVAASLAETLFMSDFSSTTLTLGRYLISPLIRSADCGGYSASVSIKSGRGSATHDRVLRLVGRFCTAEGAQSHALAKAIEYIRPRFGAAGVLFPHTQGAE